MVKKGSRGLINGRKTLASEEWRKSQAAKDRVAKQKATINSPDFIASEKGKNMAQARINAHKILASAEYRASEAAQRQWAGMRRHNAEQWKTAQNHARTYLASSDFQILKLKGDGANGNERPHLLRAQKAEEALALIGTDRYNHDDVQYFVAIWQLRIKHFEAKEREKAVNPFINLRHKKAQETARANLASTEYLVMKTKGGAANGHERPHVKRGEAAEAALAQIGTAQYVHEDVRYFNERWAGSQREKRDCQKAKDAKEAKALEAETHND